MFSNGCEYLDFLSAFCERCNKYQDGIEKSECCPIEYQISKTNMTGDKEDFPYGDLVPIGNSCRYACKEFVTDDKETMKAYKDMIENQLDAKEES